MNMQSESRRWYVERLKKQIEYENEEIKKGAKIKK